MTITSNLPNALVVGPQKAGTTWIHEYLKTRGDIALPFRVKETFFFDRYFDRGLRWYAGQFSKASPVEGVVEVAPTYFQNPDVRQRVKETLGDVKIICTLREPIARAQSLYRHLQRFGQDVGSFGDVLDTFPAVIESSRYAENVSSWIRCFPKHQVLVLFTEELRDDPVLFTKRLCQFLCCPYVPPASHLLDKRINPTEVARCKPLARTAKIISDTLRHYQIFFPVAAAKSMGLKRLLLMRPTKGEGAKISDEEARRFMEIIGAQHESLAELLQREIPWPRNTQIGQTTDEPLGRRLRDEQ